MYGSVAIEMQTSFNLLGESFYLLPQKAIFWKEQKTLLLADTHFGKITHFRKAGIAIPDSAAIQNFHRFQTLVDDLNPERVIFLGDLFHSDLNTEWLAFKKLIKSRPDISFELILGNHDILHKQTYANSNLKVYGETLEIGPFIFSHEPLEKPNLFNIYGHIHPGVRMLGHARQSMRLPCFFFRPNSGVLPAFGEFTGLHILQPNRDDTIFLIVDDKVIRGGV